MLSLDTSDGPTSGRVEFQTRLDIKDSSLPADDSVEDLELSHDEQLLLIRARTTLVVYSFSRQSVVNVIRRPGDVPDEFRLPGSTEAFVSLQFTQAHFSRDDQVRRSGGHARVFGWAKGKNSVKVLPQYFAYGSVSWQDH